MSTATCISSPRTSDCALEQNLALFLQAGEVQNGEVQNGDPPGALANPEIVAYTQQGCTARWRLDGSSDPTVSIHLWKIHGCLHALNRSLGHYWEHIQKGLAILDEAAESQEIGKSMSDRLAGHVPIEKLLPCSDGWSNLLSRDQVKRAGRRPERLFGSRNISRFSKSS